MGETATDVEAVDTRFPELTESELDRIFADMQREGFCRLDDLFAEEHLREARLLPGSLYLFFGYQTIHANESYDADQLRAT